MVTIEMWKKIREMYYHEKKSMRVIAKELRISRNTVSKYLKSDEEPIYHNKNEKPEKFKEFMPIIKDLMDKGLIGTVICERIKSQGYSGTQTTVYRYLKKLGWKDKRDKSTRFETVPGEQMQYDWTEKKIKIGNQEVLIYIHCLILCFSRAKFFTVSLDKTSASIIRAILAGIEYLGGYCRNLVIDNAKGMILSHNKKLRVVEYNEDFLLFTTKYNIKPLACLPYRARTKGKVERPFYYLQEHLLRDIDVVSLEELEKKLKDFTEKVNSMYHKSLNRTVKEAYVEEKPFLQSLKQIDLSNLFIKDIRKVSCDGYISYKTNFYPVPMKYCHKKVLIENVMGKKLNIYGENLTIIKSHTIENGNKYNRIPHPEHIFINNKIMEKKKRIQSQTLKVFIELFEEDGKRFIEGIEVATGLNSYYHLLSIIEFVEIYGRDRVLEVIRICLQINSFHKNYVKTLLNQSIPETPYIPPKFITLPEKKIKCSLNQYKALTEV